MKGKAVGKNWHFFQRNIR